VPVKTTCCPSESGMASAPVGRHWQGDNWRVCVTRFAFSEDFTEPALANAGLSAVREKLFCRRRWRYTRSRSADERGRKPLRQ
jgi:hypothetical protein